MPFAGPKTCRGAASRSTPGKGAGLPPQDTPWGTADKGLAPQSVRRRLTTTGVATGAGDAFSHSWDKRGLSFCLLSLHLRPSLHHPSAQLPGKLNYLFFPTAFSHTLSWGEFRRYWSGKFLCTAARPTPPNMNRRVVPYWTFVQRHRLRHALRRHTLGAEADKGM